MDRRELRLNKQVFDVNQTHGLTPSVPGMFQDHQRVKQLQMINNCMGYQNKITTPENIQMFQNPRQRFKSQDEDRLRNLPYSMPQSSLNKNSSQAQLADQKQENYNVDYNSPPKQQIPGELRRNLSVFLQQGKHLLY